MQDINNLNFDSIENNDNLFENDFPKETNINAEKMDKKISNKKEIKENNSIQEHKKCVPLQIYQKVYLDKQKLITEINNLNEEINNINKNSNKLPELENEIKDLQRIKKRSRIND